MSKKKPIKKKLTKKELEVRDAYLDEAREIANKLSIHLYDVGVNPIYFWLCYANFLRSKQVLTNPELVKQIDKEVQHFLIKNKSLIEGESKSATA